MVGDFQDESFKMSTFLQFAEIVAIKRMPEIVVNHERELVNGLTGNPEGSVNIETVGKSNYKAKVKL